jgi:hypothetical protein
MIFRVHFSKSPIGKTDQSGTNTFVEEKTGEQVVDWQIIHSPAAAAFTHSCQLIFNNQAANEISPKRWVSWNRYSDLNAEQAQPLFDELNRNLDYCVDNNYIPFDSSYRVHKDLTSSELLARLNAIHYRFEQDLENKQVQLTATQDYLDTLERLNKLVHDLEKTTGEWGSEFYVLRHSSDHVRSIFPKCTDEIYNCFEHNTLNGDLFSDFFTVGKDLQHAFHTNDVALVVNGEVKPQSVISGSVAFACNPNYFGKPWDFGAEQTEQKFAKWCEQNRISDYLDPTEPQYKMGRAPVGKLLNHTAESLYNLITATPYVCKVELIGE